MKNGNISTEHQPPGSARRPDETVGGDSNDSRTKTGVAGAKPEPGKTSQSNADSADVVPGVKRRD